ncbi:MAG TPA: BrnA antitoxin family protein [Thermoanaerobaculia bacterium]
MKEEDIALTEEHPELDLQHVVTVIKRHGLEPAPPKSSVSLRIDRDVLEWFKAQGPGYQTRINMILRAFRDASI